MNDNFYGYSDDQFRLSSDETVIDDEEATVLDDEEATVLDDGVAMKPDNGGVFGTGDRPTVFVSAEEVSVDGGVPEPEFEKTVFVKNVEISRNTYDQINQNLQGIHNQPVHSSSWLFDENPGQPEPQKSDTGFKPQNGKSKTVETAESFDGWAGEETVLSDTSEEAVSNQPVSGKPAASQMEKAKKPAVEKADESILFSETGYSDNAEKVHLWQDSSNAPDTILNMSVSDLNQKMAGGPAYSLKKAGVKDLDSLFSSGLIDRYYSARPQKLLNWAKADNQKRTELLREAALDISRPLFSRKRLVTEKNNERVYKLDLLCVPALQFINLVGLDQWLHDLSAEQKEIPTHTVQLTFHGERANISPLLAATDNLMKKYPELSVTRIIRAMPEQPTLEDTLYQFPELGKIFTDTEYSSLKMAAQLLVPEKPDSEILLTKIYSAANADDGAEEWIRKIENLSNELRGNADKTLRQRFLFEGSQVFIKKLKDVRHSQTTRLREMLISGGETSETKKELEKCIKLTEILYNTAVPEVTQALAKVQQEGLQPEMAVWMGNSAFADKSYWWMKMTKYDRLRNCLKAAQKVSMFYFFEPDEAFKLISQMPYSFMLLNILQGVQILQKENDGKPVQNKTWIIPFIRTSETIGKWKTAAAEIAVCSSCFGVSIGLNPAFCWQK